MRLNKLETPRIQRPALPYSSLHPSNWTSEIVGIGVLKLRFCDNREKHVYSLELLRMPCLSYCENKAHRETSFTKAAHEPSARHAGARSAAPSFPSLILTLAPGRHLREAAAGFSTHQDVTDLETRRAFASERG